MLEFFFLQVQIRFFLTKRCLISYVVHVLISNGDGWWFEFSGWHPGHPAVEMGT